MGLHAKPDVAAFQAVLADIGAEAPDCAMFEDSLKNLATVRLPLRREIEDRRTTLAGMDCNRHKGGEGRVFFRVASTFVSGTSKF